MKLIKSITRLLVPIICVAGVIFFGGAFICYFVETIIIITKYNVRTTELLSFLGFFTVLLIIIDAILSLAPKGEKSAQK